jgi:Transposase
MKGNRKSRGKGSSLVKGQIRRGQPREAVAGIDIGASEHWVCGPPRPDGSPNVQVFRTTTPELTRLAAWLCDQKIESVAMESTGVYWIPLYELLEAHGFEVLLINPQKVDKRAPARKSDMVSSRESILEHRFPVRIGSGLLTCPVYTGRPAQIVAALGTWPLLIRFAQAPLPAPQGEARRVYPDDGVAVVGADAPAGARSRKRRFSFRSIVPPSAADGSSRSSETSCPDGVAGMRRGTPPASAPGLPRRGTGGGLER